MRKFFLIALFLISCSSALFSYPFEKISSLKELKAENSQDEEIFLLCYKEGCPPCSRIRNFLMQRPLPYAKKLFLANTHEVANLSDLYEIKLVPTLLIFSPKQNRIEAKVGSLQVLEALQSIER